jgi:hypothetical protein
MTGMALTMALLVPPGRAPAAPDPTPTAPVRGGPTATRPAPDRVSDPDRELGPRWRDSTDRAVTTSSDPTGLHVLVADRRDAYRWRTAASLAEPGIDTDQWIGQLCLTGGGRHAVVVYAPRQFANREHLMDRGAFAAVVDLSTGAVTKLPERVTLAYYNPGCGADDRAVLSRLEQSSTAARTWLGIVHVPTAGLSSSFVAASQVTSALPVGDGIVAAHGHDVVEFASDGAPRRRTRTTGTPYRLTADGRNAVALQVARGTRTTFARYAGGSVTVVGSAPAGSVKLRPGVAGQVNAVGARARQRLGGLPSLWRTVDAPPDSDVSTSGALTVTRAVTGREAAGRSGLRRADAGPAEVELAARLASGRELRFRVRPAVGVAGRRPAPPERAAPRRPGVDGSIQAAPPPDNATTPWDLDRACAVPRNDPTIQVYQPTPEQAEWAANLAVQGKLTFQRPANWNNSGLPAWSPQGMFPPLALSGGGRVPAQVMLAILAQESNLWQASWHVVDASAGNPLTSQGFYGLETGDPRLIDWTKVDCGYGAGQVTTGMRMADTGQVVNDIAMDYTKQKTVVVDYATNVAAALRLLQSKWNETYDAGLLANGGDPRFIENWWFAIWAYNTGFHPAPQPPQPSGTPWGVGWANNPANPRYPADRQRFLTAPLDVPAQHGNPAADDEVGYDNAKHPNHWSYPERVIGFAYTSLRRYDYQFGTWGPTYRTADISDDDGGQKDVDLAQPARFTFCVRDRNLCDPATSQVPGDHPEEPAGPCTRADLKCWWHFPAAWTDCARHCGLEDLSYPDVEPRPLATSIYPPQCAVETLPSGVRIIDDIDYPMVVGPSGCSRTWTAGGSFGFTFASTTRDGQTIFPSKVDTHQVGAGFGGHFWFAHTQTDTAANRPLKVTGNWFINATNAWTRVFVHVPDHGAHTRQADYRIYGPTGALLGHRAIPTRHEANTWLDIGVFDFRGAGTPRVELSNFTRDGTGVHDIAWDAIAVQPLSAKPRHFVVAMGDSFSSGEGAGYYDRVSDQYGDDAPNRNACHRSSRAWSRQVVIPNAPGGRTVAALADARHAELDYHFVACSGAVTANVLSTTTASGGQAPPNSSGERPAGQFGELTQIDQGFLDRNTTLVVLTIGGNDARWVDVILECVQLVDCSVPGYTKPGDTAPLRDVVAHRFTQVVKPDVARVIAEIRVRAPDAWIVLAGYPQLFRSGSAYEIPPVLWPEGMRWGLSDGETAFLNDMARLAVTELLVTDVPNKINSVDVRAEFAGHELGSPGSENYLNTWLPGDRYNLTPDDDGEPNDSNHSPHSMHPNVAGYEAYAGAVSDRLNALSYRW